MLRTASLDRVIFFNHVQDVLVVKILRYGAKQPKVDAFAREMFRNPGRRITCYLLPAVVGELHDSLSSTSHPRMSILQLYEYRWSQWNPQLPGLGARTQVLVSYTY